MLGELGKSKRRSIFSYLRDKKSKLCFLRETYSDLNDETIRRNQWGGKYSFPTAPGAVKVLAVLINPSVRDFLLSNWTELS